MVTLRSLKPLLLVRIQLAAPLSVSPTDCQKRDIAVIHARGWPSPSVNGAGDVGSVIYNSTRCPAERWHAELAA